MWREYSADRPRGRLAPLAAAPVDGDDQADERARTWRERPADQRAEHAAKSNPEAASDHVFARGDVELRLSPPNYFGSTFVTAPVLTTTGPLSKTRCGAPAIPSSILALDRERAGASPSIAGAVRGCSGITRG